MTLRNIIIFALALVSQSGHALADNWGVDVSHSTFGFSVRHMMISNTKGEFTKFDGQFVLDDKTPTKSTVQLTVDVASLDTRDKKRDDHLRNADFFDVAKFPKATFVSTKIKKVGSGYAVTGNLTLRGVTKPITVTVTLTKPVKTPFGTIARGATVTGTLNRKDFGISWNKALDTGGLAVGEQVKLDIELELVKK